MSTSSNLPDKGSAGVRGKRMDVPVKQARPLAQTAQPEKTVSGGLLAKVHKQISESIKVVGVKKETKNVFDIDKGIKGMVHDRSFGVVSLEVGKKSRYLDLMAKAEGRGLQATVGTGASSSLEVHAGKATVQGEVGITGLREASQARINVTVGKSLGHLFISLKDVVMDGMKESLDQGVLAPPSLKSFRLALCKPILTVQLEQRDLQNGTLALAKFNLANVMDWVGEGLEKGELPNLGKMITGESKVFDAKLKQTYENMGEAYEKTFRQMEKEGVLERIGEQFTHALGDWRSDGEGYAPEVLDRLALDTMKSQVLARLLALPPENGNALPIFLLASRLHNDFVLNPQAPGHNEMRS
ncbi:hypothetical protein ACILG0_18850 [Pseudomonadota bacterium AL_CKDN230030165-1A_HGKHYDSX7]